MQGFIFAVNTAAEKCPSILDAPLNFDSHLSVKCRSRPPGHGVCSQSVSRTTTMQGFVLITITATENCNLVLDST